MRTTVTLDDDVLEAVRARARASGKKLGDVLSELVRQGLLASAESRAKSGLPVFKIRPNAPIIPSTRAGELF